MVFILSVIVVAVALILLIVLRPSLTEGRIGKGLAFIAFFLLPIIAVAIGTSSHFENSKSTKFCLSCHVMEPYGTSLYIDDSSFLPANHFQNNRVPKETACFTCHTQYTMFGDAQSKLRGLRHVYFNYIGGIPEKIELYTPYDNRECLHCHGSARSFEEQKIHISIMADVKSNQVRCIDCHNLIHNIDELSRQKLWQSKAIK